VSVFIRLTKKLNFNMFYEIVARFHVKSRFAGLLKTAQPEYPVLRMGMNG